MKKKTRLNFKRVYLLQKRSDFFTGRNKKRPFVVVLVLARGIIQFAYRTSDPSTDELVILYARGIDQIIDRDRTVCAIFVESICLTAPYQLFMYADLFDQRIDSVLAPEFLIGREKRASNALEGKIDNCHGVLLP